MQKPIHEICKLIKAPTEAEFYEQVYLNDSIYSDALKQAIEDGLSESEAETKAAQAEQNYNDELYKAWQHAVEATVESWLSAVSGDKLNITFDWPQDTLTIEETESEALGRAIIDCVNGHGMFRFDNLEEAMASGPYSYEEFCTSHFHWLKHYDSIYGDNSMNYERHAEHYFHNL